MASYPNEPRDVEQSCTNFRGDWQRLMLECLGHNRDNPRQICIVLSQHSRMISVGKKLKRNQRKNKQIKQVKDIRTCRYL